MTGGRSWGQCWGGVLVTLLQGLVAVPPTASSTYNWVYSRLHLIAKICFSIASNIQSKNRQINTSYFDVFSTTFVAGFIVGNVVSLTLLSDEATSCVCTS